MTPTTTGTLLDPASLALANAAPFFGRMRRVVDGQGIVRWIDQSADHRVRSNPERVLAALRAGLGA